MAAGPRDSRRRRLVLGLSAALCAAVVGYTLTRPKESPLDRFKREVAEAVPVGASRETAVAWAREMGTAFPERSYEPAVLGPPGRTIGEIAGMGRADLESFVEATIPWGRYEVNGETAPNQLWVFIPLDADGRVKGHYFYSLAELADYERVRAEARGERLP
jgi:hypothetical protein